MTSLEESLPRLSAVVPPLPARLQGLIRQGEALRAAVQRLLEQVDQRSDEALALGEGTTRVLDGFEEEANQRRLAVEAGVDEVEGQLEECTQALQEGQAELGTRLDGARDAFNQLQQALEAAATAAREAQSDVEEGLGRLDQGLQDGQQQLEQAVSAVEDDMEALARAGEEARATVGGALDRLQAVLRETMGAVQDRLARSAQAFATAQDTLTGRIGEERTALAEARRELEAEVRSRVERELTEPAAVALRLVRESVERFAEAAAETQELAAAHRSAVEAGFDELGEAMDPLPQGIAQVQQGAETVGVAWA